MISLPSPNARQVVIYRRKKKKIESIAYKDSPRFFWSICSSKFVDDFMNECYRLVILPIGTTVLSQNGTSGHAKTGSLWVAFSSSLFNRNEYLKWVSNLPNIGEEFTFSFASINRGCRTDVCFCCWWSLYEARPRLHLKVAPTPVLSFSFWTRPFPPNLKHQQGTILTSKLVVFDFHFELEITRSP